MRRMIAILMFVAFGLGCNCDNHYHYDSTWESYGEAYDAGFHAGAVQEHRAHDWDIISSYTVACIFSEPTTSTVSTDVETSVTAWQRALRQMEDNARGRF